MNFDRSAALDEIDRAIDIALFYRGQADRFQYPRRFSSVTRWCPMNPPAPVTSTRAVKGALLMNRSPGSCDCDLTRRALGGPVSSCDARHMRSGGPGHGLAPRASDAATTGRSRSLW